MVKLYQPLLKLMLLVCYNTLKDYSDKIKELKEISDSYKGFSSDNCDSTLFIGVVKSSNK